jgi:putative ABC transport system ATP-binding protein
MQNIVTISNLTKIYRLGKVDVPALRGVDLQIRRGEFIAIMGPSGCGKSTLLHIMGGLLSPTSGDIMIEDKNLARCSDRERTEVRRAKIGFVFQRFNLFPTITARENLVLARQIRGNGSFDSHTIEEILGILGLREKMNHKPLELSGGEQQRVALARALISRPAILLADEPTGNLDTVNSQIVLTMLRDLNLRFNQTVVMITHNSEAASYAHRIVEMRDGRILIQPRGELHVEHEDIFSH